MFKYIAALLFSLSITAVFAEDPTSTFPADMMYLDKSIDSLCFADWDDNTSVVPLNNCGIAKLNYQRSGLNETLINKGFIGYDWTDPKTQSQGFSYYKYYPAGNRLYWLYTINNEGGSGNFTAIDLVKRKNPEIFKIEEIANGDRCNGGIEDVEEHNRRLTFSVNLTAFDFLTLANNNERGLKAYEDLAACATCCVAKAYYEVDINSDPEIKYIDISKRSTPSMPDQGLYQGCFNRVLSNHLAKGETQFNYSKLRNFVNEFNNTCVVQAGN